MRFGIVITSRVNSSRIPAKALKKINGAPLIEHLLKRCVATGLPVCLAVPSSDADSFYFITNRYPGVTLLVGQDDDPLARLTRVANQMQFDAVIRVCHDKIFIDPDLVALAVETFERKNLDYLYSSQFIPGTGFEVISKQVLNLASAKYKNVEHVSYAIKNLTGNSHNLAIPPDYRFACRLLVDYPDDLQLLELVLAALGNDCTLPQVIAFLRNNTWALKLNQLPKVTVYTCAYNAERFLEKCMGSVAEQVGFRQMEYILVDDHSQDKTPILMAEMASKFPNVRFVRNPANLGLSSSSNVALAEARGTYIIRLDADDYFVGNDVIQRLLNEIEETEKDAIYPNNYFGSMAKVQNGKEAHHVGGALFRRSAVNHVKFTEMLRGYEGLDFFLRAKDQINVGYYGKPTFFYRQRKDSMSRTNLAERARIRAEIEARAGA